MLRFSKLTAVALILGTVFATSVFSQGEIAYIPFIVNMGATVSITPPAGSSGTGTTAKVSAGKQTTLTITLGTTSVSHREQRRSNTPAVASYRNGRVSLDLNPQQFKNTEIALFSASGKRILRGKASASSGGAAISRSNIAQGVYMLSAKGTNGNSFVTKLIHNGGRLNINITFDGQDRILAKQANTYGSWTITASEAGYVDTSYTFAPVVGTNPLQYIQLRTGTSGGVTDKYCRWGGEPENCWEINLFLEGATTPAECEASYGEIVTNCNAPTSGTWCRLDGSGCALLLSGGVAACTNDYNGTAYSGTNCTGTILGTPSTGGSAVPAAPTGVTATSTSPRSITVSWSATSGATGYYIYRGTRSDFVGYTLVGTSTTTSYTATELTAGITYYYRVAAYNSNGESPLSNIVSATTQSLSAPTGVTATATSSSSITVNWSAVLETYTYSIYRSLSSDGTYTQIKVLWAEKGSSYKDTNLVTNTTYYYRVAADDTSSRSSPVSATTLFSGATDSGNYYTDPRDGKTYRTVQINNKIWMAENLNYQGNGAVGMGECYGWSRSNCDKYGGLYALVSRKTHLL
jgi:hypothetical protein